MKRHKSRNLRFQTYPKKYLKIEMRIRNKFSEFCSSFCVLWSVFHLCKTDAMQYLNLTPLYLIAASRKHWNTWKIYMFETISGEHLRRRLSTFYTKLIERHAKITKKLQLLAKEPKTMFLIFGPAAQNSFLMLSQGITQGLIPILWILWANIAAQEKVSSRLIRVLPLGGYCSVLIRGCPPQPN